MSTYTYTTPSNPKAFKATYLDVPMQRPTTLEPRHTWISRYSSLLPKAFNPYMPKHPCTSPYYAKAINPNIPRYNYTIPYNSRGFNPIYNPIHLKITRYNPTVFNQSYLDIPIQPHISRIPIYNLYTYISYPHTTPYNPKVFHLKTLSPKPSTLNTKSANPQPRTLNPKP